MRTFSNTGWGGRVPSAYPGGNTATLANGSVLPTSNEGNPTNTLGPGATMPLGSQPARSNPGRRGRAQMPQSWQSGGQNGSTPWQSQQLAANEASGQPVEVSAGVWVYPNGQPVTGAQLAALNSASTVLPASSDAENATVLAEEQAATASTTATATPAATSWLDESTITSSYTNGQVVLAGGAILGLIYLFKRH